MKKLIKNISWLILILLTFSACQNVKDGLTGKKQTNSDEFLVKKKDPLVLPPEFEKLPEPKSLERIDILDDIDLEASIQNEMGSNKKIYKKNKTNSSLEKSILEKIKNN
mgnify:FL=1|jgi:hypothetical protein|tara:strand:+ start:44 stop:370 length:327 start_codon:yes stop_codon:yes gene_type:complete